MNQNRRRAVLCGLLAGVLALATALVWLRFARDGVVKDVVTHGLPIVVAAISAAVSAIAMCASPRRALALAGLACLVTFGLVVLVDYSVILAALTPGLTGSIQWHGKTLLLVRHVTACALGLFGGAMLGVRSAPPARVRA